MAGESPAHELISRSLSLWQGGTDPGFYLDYHFEQHASQQSSICNKNSVFTTATGTISDDQPNGGVKCTGARYVFARDSRGSGG